MAENEILDVGSPRRYRLWKRALSTTDFNPEEVAGCLPDEFVSVMRKQLQGTPLHLILKACGQDRAALQAAMASCRNKDLAGFVRQAFAITGSAQASVIAGKVAELLVEQLLGRCAAYVMRKDLCQEKGQYEQLQQATIRKLEGCKPEIVKLLSASLQNEKIPRQARSIRVRPSARVLASISLLKPTVVNADHGARRV